MHIRPSSRASAAFPLIYPVWLARLQRDALALTPDLQEAAAIAARRSHAMWGGGVGGRVCQEAG